MNIIETLVKPALSFGLSKALQRLRRLQTSYQAAFANPEVEPRVVELAIRDIKAVFGRAGFLDEPLVQLLDELARSGLIDQLCISALTGENINRTRLLFTIQANNHYPVLGNDKPDFATLFDQFIRIIHNSAEKLHINVKELEKDIAAKRQLQAAGILRGNGAFHSLRLENRKNTDITRLYETLPWLSTSSLDCSNFIRSTSSATLAHFADITAEGPSNRQVRLAHEKIYVEPTLSNSSATESAQRILRLFHSEQPQVGNIHVFTFANLLQNFSQIVILGDPGGGKTTLVRIHCHRVGMISSETGDILPIFVTVRYFEAAQNLLPQLSMLEFIRNELVRQANCAVPLASDPLLYALMFGRCFIVFDGLDEIIDIGRRREFVTTVLQFMDSYPLNRYVVTSRKIGYSEAPLRDPPTFILSPFGTDETRSYASLSASNVFGVSASLVDLEVERFINESHKNAKEFLGSPLLLSLIIWLFFSTQRIPDGRLNIYRECAELMFQRWDTLRGIYPDVPSPFRLFSLLVFLAPSFYLDRSLQAGASRSWLREAVKKFFEIDLNEDAETRAWEAATKFTDHLIGRAWVLHEVGPDRFEFTHRTFLEYFFAKHLHEKHDTIDQLCDELDQHIARSEWVVPAHLALQLKIDGSPSRAGRASERLRNLSTRKRQRGAKTFARDQSAIVTFIAEATRYLQPNELRLEEIAELVTLKGISRNDGASLVFNVLRNPNDMRDAVYRGIAVGMGKLYEEKELERFGVGVDWMKANHYLNLFESDHVGYLPGAIGKSIDCIVDVVSKHLTGACERGIGFQKIVFDLTGDYEKAFSAPPTAHAWAASCARPFIRLDWRFIDSITILKELKRLDLEGQRQEASFISFGAAIFGSLLGVPPVSVSGQATVLDTVGPDLLSFIASATFQKAEFRTAALTALLVARETVMDHSHYKGMEQLNLDLVSTIKSFLRNNEKMISVETRRLVRQYIEGPGRIVREEFQEVPKSPQSLLGWSNEFV